MLIIMLKFVVMVVHCNVMTIIDHGVATHGYGKVEFKHPYHLLRMRTVRKLVISQLTLPIPL